GIRFQLVKVAAAELVPLGRIVAEPLAKFGTGPDFFQPAFDLKRSLLDPPGPQALHQKSITVRTAGRIVRAFQLDHGNSLSMLILVIEPRARPLCRLTYALQCGRCAHERRDR